MAAMRISLSAGNVRSWPTEPRASCCGHDILCRHPSRSADTLLHVVHGVCVDHIEVAGAAPRLRERKRKHEKVALGLEHMVGLTDRLHPTTVFESALQRSDIHTTPRGLLGALLTNILHLTHSAAEAPGNAANHARDLVAQPAGAVHIKSRRPS